MAEQIVEVEGPVHLDEVTTRIREAWGLKRAGARIQDAVESAVEVSVRAGRLERSGAFLSIPGRSPRVRNRGNVRSANLRRPEALPPAEMELAILSVVRSNFGATEDQVALATARRLGFKATSSQLKEVIAQVITDAVAKDLLARRNGLLVMGESAPGC